MLPCLQVITAQVLDATIVAQVRDATIAAAHFAGSFAKGAVAPAMKASGQGYSKGWLGSEEGT